MELWGLTGGIASGKSTVSTRLQEKGAFIIDADVLAREVVDKGTQGLQEIVATFGKQILLPNGTLNRKALGKLVFAYPEAKKVLEQITHPRIAQRAQELMEQQADRGGEVVVYDAPLLIENNLHLGMAEVLVVATSPDVQLKRIINRDGLTEAEAQARMASQMPLEEKQKVATAIFWNNGLLEELMEQVDRFWAGKMMI